MTQAGIDPQKLRKDAVLANDLVLSISPKWFRPKDPEAHGTWDDERLQTFTAAATTMLKQRFGARLVTAVLHLDEATPHVQAVVVPITRKREGEGNRLSSKDYFGPEKLTALQQDWEDRLTPHGVGPRTRASRATHTTLREYYGTLAATSTEDVREPRSVRTAATGHSGATGGPSGPRWRVAKSRSEAAA